MSKSEVEAIMKVLNLYTLTRVDNDDFSLFENILSDRKTRKDIDSSERISLQKFVDQMYGEDITVQMFNGFYTFFTIEHISKEFDILKIAKDKSRIINIELKSEMIPLEKIEKQLIQNAYYLRSISTEIYSFTYVSDENKFYKLDDVHGLKECFGKEIADMLKSFGPYYEYDLEDLFQAKDFLISPLNTPDKFLEKKYFLTEQQNNVKKDILNKIKNIEKETILGINGSPGTGKSLLIFDLAREISDCQSVCIIHSGILSRGHMYLKSKMENVDIIAAKESKDYDFKQIDCIFIDEAQRIYKNQFENIKEKVVLNKKVLILAYDCRQVLAESEVKRNMSRKIEEIVEKKYVLSEKIRTNPELAEFITRILDLNKARRNHRYTYDKVDIIYASSKEEAGEIIDKYRREQYKFINYTESKYKSQSFDQYGGEFTTHEVVGQEYDNVFMVLDNTFFYDEHNKLCAKEHPYPNYLYLNLFFQGISRTREHLCILIIGDQQLFHKILEIKNDFD